MPRTTLDIDASVLRELRRRSDRERKSMGRVASELLAEALASNDQPSNARALAWNSGDLGSPRVDLDDKEAVRRVLGQDT